MTANDPDVTECSVGGRTVAVRTETEAETERARELMDEAGILRDLVDELRPDDAVLDVGANVGLYTLFAAQVADSVVAVEPHPENLDALEANLDRNGVSATIVRGALSDEPGETELYLAGDEAGVGTHTLAEDQVSESSLTVPRYAGDDLIARGEIPEPTVLKLDVQGAEYRVLRGLSAALDSGRVRAIYCELHPVQVETIGGSVDELLALLDDHGFERSTLVEKEDGTSNIKAVRRR